MLFKGTFNWYCEIHTLYTHTKNKDKNKALNNFIVQLTKILKVSRESIYIYFNNDKDNYRIEEEKEN